MVRIDSMEKYYEMGENKIHVLKDVSLSVKKGEFLTVLGASGSGKSTLMNMIGCMDLFDSGTYFLDDTPVHDCDEKALAVLRNQKIGFIFQKYHLIPQYTVLQNVLIPLLIRGMTRREATEVAQEQIQGVGLWDRIDHKPSELSGGQQQRVAIARALVTKPALLLADEPTGALDSSTGKEILTLFNRLNKDGNTIIMITHDKNVAAYSERIVYLNDGVLSC